MIIKTSKNFDRWYEVKALIRKAYLENLRSKSEESGYDRKAEARRKRLKLFNDEPKFAEFFNWLNAIKIRTKTTDAEFGKLINVNATMVKWYRNWNTYGGYFPSEETIQKLESLERQLNANVILVERTYRIRKGKDVYKVDREWKKRAIKQNAVGKRSAA